MRILLTRPRPDAERTARRIADIGHQPVVAPVIEIVPTPTALPHGVSEAVLATSANVAAVAGTLPDAVRAKPFYAVGRRTADAARAAGFRDVRMSEGGAESLAALVALTLQRPASLLYLAGHDRKPTIETALADAGYAIVTHVAYEARAVSAWPTDVIEDLRQDRLGGALHYSRRSASLAIERARQDACLDGFLRLRHWCLSVDVEAPLRAAAASRTAVAAEATERSLFSLLPATDMCR